MPQLMYTQKLPTKTGLKPQKKTIQCKRNFQKNRKLAQ